MFQVKNIVRVDSETVKVTVTMDAKEFNKAKKQGLGQLFGIDISNHVFREYGIKAYNPSVDGIKSRAVQGVKTLQLYYKDDAWVYNDNVVRVDFAAKRVAA
jgi:hypothetical protein